MSNDTTRGSTNHPAGSLLVLPKGKPLPHGYKSVTAAQARKSYNLAFVNELIADAAPEILTAHRTKRYSGRGSMGKKRESVVSQSQLDGSFRSRGRRP